MPEKLGHYLAGQGLPGTIADMPNSKAASRAFIPGVGTAVGVFPEDNTLAPPLINGARIDLSSIQDLRLSAIKGMSNYASQHIQDANKYFPRPTLSTATSGHSADDVLSTTADPKSYAPKPANEETFAHVGEFLGSLIVSTPALSKRSGREIAHGTNSSVSDSTFGSFLDSRNEDFKTQPQPILAANEKNAAEVGAFELKSEALSELEKNRYHPATKAKKSTSYLNRGSSDGEMGIISQGLYTLQQGSFGKFIPDGTGVTVADLRKAALEVLLKAQSIDSNDAHSVTLEILKEGNIFAGSDGVMFLPNDTQWGMGKVAVNSMRIRATKAMSKFNTDSGLQARGHDDLMTIKSEKLGFGEIGSDTPGGTYTDQDGKEHSLGNLGTVNNGSSFGTMNSPSEQFGGPAPFGMFWPVFFLLLILGLATFIIGAIIALINLADAPVKVPEQPWNLAYGSNIADAPGQIFFEFIKKMYGFPREGADNVWDAMRGFLLFYGINTNIVPPSVPAADITQSVLNILLTPSYYLPVTKKVMTEATRITKAINRFPGSGAQAGIGSFFNLLEVFFGSFTMRFFFIMIDLGKIFERDLKSRGGVAHGNAVVISAAEQERHNILHPGFRNSLSRWHGGSTPMNPLSAHLFNSLLLKGYDHSGPAAFTGGSKNSYASVKSFQATGRYSAESVEKIERQIDAEYMPFSFHDLRTNEVISLPAFITNVAENFSADYSSTHGFGRTDPVYGYTKTTRTIDFSFKLVAYNRSDHEYVYYVLNKLVTMLYPQRDKGQPRGNASKEEIQFIQPFSQRVAASPVVRIRLGDLISSNASTSAFRKIFGGYETMTSTGDGGLSADKLEEKVSALGSARDTAKIMLLKDAGTTGDFIVPQGSTLFIQKENDPKNSKNQFAVSTRYARKAKMTEFLQVETTDKSSPDNDKASKTKTFLVLQFSLDDELDAYAFGGQAALAVYRTANPSFPIPPPPFGSSGDDLSFIMEENGSSHKNCTPIFTTDDLDTKIKSYADSDVLKWIEPNSTEEEHKTSKFADPAAGSPEEKELNNFKAMMNNAKKFIEEDGEYGKIQKVDEFLSEGNNDLKRAFSSNKGRGLAGVITTMGLDYNDVQWGTSQEEGMIEAGLRAPKSININISFAPIHDMPLGLAASGEMFAPSHPVGILSARRIDAYKTNDAEIEELELKKEEAKSTVSYMPDTADPGEPQLPFG